MIVDEKRSFGTYVLLSLVTCGIYHYVFFHGIAKDMNIVCKGDGEETPSIGEFILFSILTCGIYSYYWYYKLADRQHKNSHRYNLNIQENGTTIIVWLVLGSILASVGAFLAGKIATIYNLFMYTYRYGYGYGYGYENEVAMIVQMIISSLLTFIGSVGYYIAMHILTKNMNLLAYAYNHNGGNAQAQPGFGGYNAPNYNNPNYAQSNGYNQNTNGVSLICRSGEFAGCSFPLNMNEPVTIGRNPSCKIKFSPNTPKVSRTHCTVFYDGMVWIIDNDSSYGTFLDNGTKLLPNSKMMLQKGSGFYLGNQDISFYIN